MQATSVRREHSPVYAARRVSKLAALQVLTVSVPEPVGMKRNQMSRTNDTPKPSSHTAGNVGPVLAAPMVLKECGPAVMSMALEH